MGTPRRNNNFREILELDIEFPLCLWYAIEDMMCEREMRLHEMLIDLMELGFLHQRKDPDPWERTEVGVEKKAIRLSIPNRLMAGIDAGAGIIGLQPFLIHLWGLGILSLAPPEMHANGYARHQDERGYGRC
jgi:hypothetical protein